MTTATLPSSLPGPTPVPERPEVQTLLDQLLSCSPQEKRFLLEQLLRDMLGDNPPKELGIYKDVGVPYVYILEPEHHARLFVTPERLAQWAKQDHTNSSSHVDVVAMLKRGNEEEVKAYLAARNL